MAAPHRRREAKGGVGRSGRRRDAVRGILLLASVGLLLAADAPQDAASKKDLEKMQGDWVVVSYVRDGEKIPDDDAQALFRTVKGNEYTVSRFDKVIGGGTFTIDATKKP